MSGVWREAEESRLGLLIPSLGGSRFTMMSSLVTGSGTLSLTSHWTPFSWALRVKIGSALGSTIIYELSRDSSSGAVVDGSGSSATGPFLGFFFVFLPLPDTLRSWGATVESSTTLP
ncbi:hypothetical protein RRF57_003788 [Xylaria bambusicola]|uniref:Uncharacterized protein n=1 Tax=Xylaria bambusicola TaxID=326684 RepID=A0AAN7Z5P8_9PEZI